MSAALPTNPDGLWFKTMLTVMGNDKENETGDLSLAQLAPIKKVMHDARIFLLTNSFIDAVEIPGSENKHWLDLENLDPTLPERPEFLGEPFKNVWLEPVGHRVLGTYKRNGLLYDIAGVSVISTNIQNGNTAYLVSLLYLSTHEVNSRAIVGTTHLLLDTRSHNLQASQLHHWLFHLFAALSRGQHGAHKINERVRVGTGQDRHLHKIKLITYVRPKPNRKTPQPQDPTLANKQINWSHTWEVRGHWRVTQAIGKDQNGEYGVRGYTWVTPTPKARVR